MSLITGFQLRAARGLLGWTQAQLSAASHVNVNTVRRMENCGPSILSKNFHSVERLKAALESEGVEFLGESGAGVAFHHLGVRMRTYKLL